MTVGQIVYLHEEGADYWYYAVQTTPDTWDTFVSKVDYDDWELDDGIRTRYAREYTEECPEGLEVPDGVGTIRYGGDDETGYYSYAVKVCTDMWAGHGKSHLSDIYEWEKDVSDTNVGALAPEEKPLPQQPDINA